MFVSSPGPACMLTPPEHQAGSPEIHPTHDEGLSFSLPDLVGGDQWDTAASPPPRQPYPARAHDWEASGSGTQPDLSLFHTPPPPASYPHCRGSMGYNTHDEQRG